MNPNPIPCHHCGCEPIIYKALRGEREMYQVHCVCGHSASFMVTFDDALHEWDSNQVLLNVHYE